jgi:metallophosphoesterase superfamily enzyme
MWNDEHPYAIADLHGELTLLRQLLQCILTNDVNLIFLGDYVDRGEDSSRTILVLMELAQQQSCVFLRGNHDAAWLESWMGERFARCPAIPGARAIMGTHAWPDSCRQRR